MSEKAVFSGKKVAEHIETPPKIDIEPNGVELGIEGIRRIDRDGEVIIDGKNRKITPKKIDVTDKVKRERTTNTFNVLKRGLYEVRLKNKVSIPKGAVGIMFPRSTLNRYGIGMQQTAIWDSGYTGYGTLTVDIKVKKLKIPTDEKWFQLMLLKAENAGKTYDGHWQNEGDD